MEIKSLLKKRNKFNKKDNFEIRPNIYWIYILFITLVFLAGALYFGIYIFMKINTDNNEFSAENNNQDVIKKDRINNALNYFSAREKKSAEILNNHPLIVDPSL